MDELAKQEEQAYRYLIRGNMPRAIKLLFDLALKQAQRKNFDKAEALREKIYEIDPLALTEILKVSEAIEEAKSVSIDQSHLDIWRKINSTLTKGEESTLFFSLRKAEYPPDTVLYQQEDLNSRLYFIYSGKLNIIYRQGDREYFCKKLTTGDIAGDDTFFTASHCTTTLVTISSVKLRYVDRKFLPQWHKEEPALESKLHDYCLQFKSISDLLKKKDIDRRRLRRIKISGTVMIQLVNATGRSDGRTLIGDLMDISIGGVSFFIKARKKETARLLLGKSLIVKIAHAPNDIDESGTVIGVRYNPQEFRVDTDYTVHLKFDKPLDSQTIWEIENARAKS
ncbi:cyclic nucleotide-binding domain-containing protein [Thermodesulfobacteriota bacterium]